MKKPCQNKKKPGEWFYLNCDVYEVRIALYIGESSLYLKNGKKFLLKHFGENSKSIIKDIKDWIGDSSFSPNSCMDCRNHNKQDIIIFLEKLNLSDPEDMGTFAHECVHATFDILMFRNVIEKRDMADNEAAAYLLEFIFKNFLELVKKRKKKNDNTHKNTDFRG